MAVLIVAFESPSPPSGADDPGFARILADCIRLGIVDPEKVSVIGAYFDDELPMDLAERMEGS